MKFLIDAALPPWMVAAFADAGFDAVHAADIGFGRAADPAVADYARNNARCLITRDFDFADIRTYEPRDFEGIIVLTIPRDRGLAYMRILLAKLFEYLRAPDPVRGKLIVVTAERIRVRE